MQTWPWSGPVFQHRSGPSLAISTRVIAYNQITWISNFGVLNLIPEYIKFRIPYFSQIIYRNIKFHIQMNSTVFLKVNDPVIASVPVIVILLLKFDKVLKNNFNWSILQLTVRLNNMDYVKLSKSMIIYTVQKKS